MHLWDKGGKTRETVIRFTCDRDRSLDDRLAKYDIIGSVAHAVMLGRTGIISSADAVVIVEGLAALYSEAAEGRLKVDEKHEDIHSVVEERLKELKGEAAGRLHTGRSRNDQVLTDIHLWARDNISQLAAEIHALTRRLIELSDSHKNDVLPGFTHMQPAMVSSFGLWFASFAEGLCDDMQMLVNALSFVNASPLGTAAGYGTSLPIDREMTASLLKFERVLVSSPYAQASRGRTEKAIIQAVASVAGTLGRLASDVILFMSPGYAFVTLNDDFTTGSSIMPQKKNPDLFELVRARCNRLQALPNEITLMTAGMPPGYNRDYQELKITLFGAVDEINELVSVVSYALDGIVINTGIMKDTKYNVIYSAEEANRMVMQGVPFRDAYRAVAEKIGSGLFVPTDISGYSHTGSIGNTGSGIIWERAEKIMENFGGHYSPDQLFDSLMNI